MTDVGSLKKGYNYRGRIGQIGGESVERDVVKHRSNTRQWNMYILVRVITSVP